MEVPKYTSLDLARKLDRDENFYSLERNGPELVSLHRDRQLGIARRTDINLNNTTLRQSPSSVLVLTTYDFAVERPNDLLEMMWSGHPNRGQLFIHEKPINGQTIEPISIPKDTNVYDYINDELQHSLAGIELFLKYYNVLSHLSYSDRDELRSAYKDTFRDLPFITSQPNPDLNAEPLVKMQKLLSLAYNRHHA